MNEALAVTSTTGPNIESVHDVGSRQVPYPRLRLESDTRGTLPNAEAEQYAAVEKPQYLVVDVIDVQHASYGKNDSNLQRRSEEGEKHSLVKEWGRVMIPTCGGKEASATVL